MLATLIIVFREMIEAGLIVGIVLAATRGVPARSAWVSYGIIGGLLGACLVAGFASAISNMMEGYGQELFNASILSFAVIMLTWHNVWMARHGREMAQEMKAVGADVVAGRRSLLALSIVIGVAVLREGAEVVLFLYGIIISGQDSAAMMTAGGLLGVVLGAGLSALMYLGLLHIPLKRVFTVTSWMIALLAAGLAAQAVGLLQKAEVITVLTETVWNTSHALKDSSVVGSILHTLIGYNDRPNGLELITYASTLVVIFTLMRLFGRAPSATKPVLSQSSPA